MEEAGSEDPELQPLPDQPVLSLTEDRNQDQAEPDVKPLKEESVVCVSCVRTDPDFSVDVSCQIKGNEVSLISYRKSDIWKD